MQAARTRIASEDGCKLEPPLNTADVCPTCVERMFKGMFAPSPPLDLAPTYLPHTEKLYQTEHPRLVSRFDEVALVEEDEDGYHISKAWLKGASPYCLTSILVPHNDLSQTGALLSRKVMSKGCRMPHQMRKSTYGT